ncbi:hypothetical protein KDL45_00230 [bacterium]|nr:hypothetical protein [bacterium]
MRIPTPGRVRWLLFGLTLLAVFAFGAFACSGGDDDDDDDAGADDDVADDDTSDDDTSGDDDAAGDVCETNEDCPITYFCKKAVGLCGDGQGACKLSPRAGCDEGDEGCGCDDVYEPVCGCDGETYGNECDSELAEVNIASEGECP